jgi:hypothetical protein
MNPLIAHSGMLALLFSGFLRNMFEIHLPSGP